MSGPFVTKPSKKTYTTFSWQLVVLIVLLFSIPVGIVAVNTSTNYHSKAAEISVNAQQAQSQVCVGNLIQVSGQVLNVGTDRPKDCPKVGGYPSNMYQGMNQLKVDLSGYDPTGHYVSVTTYTRKGGSGQTGAFYFEGIPNGGVYNVCVRQPVPTGFVNLCNVPRDDGHDPFNTTCAKVDTHLHCAGIRLDLASTIYPQTPYPTNRPPIGISQQPTLVPTHIPTPTVYYFTPTPMPTYIYIATPTPINN